MISTSQFDPLLDSMLMTKTVIMHSRGDEVTFCVGSSFSCVAERSCSTICGQLKNWALSSWKKGMLYGLSSVTLGFLFYC